MPNGLDYSYAIPHVNGTPNPGYEHSNTPSINNLNVTSTIMHVNSNLELASVGNNPVSKTPGLKVNVRLDYSNSSQ